MYAEEMVKSYDVFASQQKIISSMYKNFCLDCKNNYFPFSVWENKHNLFLKVNVDILLFEVHVSVCQQGE